MSETSLKRVLKRTLMYSALRTWRHRREIERWVRDKMPLPAPPAVKQEIVRGFAEQYRPPAFIETGTLRGEMTDAMRRVGTFRVLHSIELDPALAAAARTRFRPYPQVEIHEGDSARLLPRIVGSLAPTMPALFWLDGHYSGEGTARGAEDTPIRRELLTILSHPCDRHVVLIDDARDFTGRNDYPTLEEIRALVKQHRPSMAMSVENDIIRITP